jgi:hypothetical protein
LNARATRFFIHLWRRTYRFRRIEGDSRRESVVPFNDVDSCLELSTSNGEVGEWLMPLVCKTGTPAAFIPAKASALGVAGSNPALSAKLLDAPNLYAFSFVFARFVPIRGFALRANPWFTFGAESRNPFMRAAATFVAFLFDRDHCHNDAMILDKDILSREES